MYIPKSSLPQTINSGIGNDNHTMFLIHGSQEDGVIKDSSFKNRQSITSNQVYISTSQKIFGNSSLYFNGSDSRINVPCSSDFNTPGDFTLDFWIRDDNVGSQYRMYWCASSDNGYSPINLCRNYANLGLYVSSTGSTWDIFSNATVATVASNTWYHIAFVRYGNVYSYYLNGALQTTLTSSLTPYNPDRQLWLGGFAGQYQPGYMQEVRFSVGIARWTAPFTPPTAPYAGQNLAMTVNGKIYQYTNL